MDRTLNRRELLVLISYAGLGLTGSFSRSAFADEKTLRKAFRRFAKQSDVEPLKTVGRMYLNSTPEEEDVAALLQSLPNADKVDDAYWDAFSGQMRSEFVAGETVSLEGWVLSRSECRLYGLLHLLA